MKSDCAGNVIDSRVTSVGCRILSACASGSRVKMAGKCYQKSGYSVIKRGWEAVMQRRVTRSVARYHARSSLHLPCHWIPVLSDLKHRDEARRTKPRQLPTDGDLMIFDSLMVQPMRDNSPHIDVTKHNDSKG